MALPPVPENLENIVVVRDYLDKLRLAIENGGTEIDPVFLSQKGQPNGVPVLDSSTLVPTSELGTGTADNTKFLRGDRTWAVPAGGGGGGVKAATIVVDPDGEGDVTTLAAGIAALPTEGGYIYMREGTYTISSTQVLPDKSIVFIGSGIDSTIINFTGTGNFFTSAFSRYYTFRSLSIDGGEVSQNQKLFVSTGTDQDVYFYDVEIEGINHIIDDVGGTDNTFTLTDVEIDLPAINFNSSFYVGNSTGTVIWNYTSVTLSEASTILNAGGAFLGSPKWVANHSYIGGPPPQFISDYQVGQVIFDGVRADRAKFIIAGNLSQIYALEATDCTISCSGSNLFIDHCYFIRVGGIGFENQYLDMTGSADELHVANSTFDGTGNITNCLLLGPVTRFEINNNRIKNFTTISVYIPGIVKGTCIGNVFTNVGTAVSETDAGSAGIYVANSGFSGSTISGGTSVQANNT